MLWLDSTHLQRSASQTAARCHRCVLPPGQWSRRPEHTIWQTDQFRPLRGTIHKTTWSHASPLCVSLAADSNNQSFRSYPASGGWDPRHLTGSDSLPCSCCPSTSIKAAATQDDQRERDRLPKKPYLLSWVRSYGNHSSTGMEICTVSMFLRERQRCQSHINYSLTINQLSADLQRAAPLQTVIHRVPETDQTVLSTCQKHVPERVRGQTPQLICVTLNTSQIALSAQTHHHLEANYLMCRRRHSNITNPHLDHHQEAVIERSPQDKISRCSDQEFIPLPLWYSSDGPILIWDLSRPTNTRDFTHDTRMVSFPNQTAAVWPTSMSRSALSSWSHRMIFLSFPPPVSTLPLLISHMQNTLPSWPLIWRMIWNAGHTSIQVNHTSTKFILYPDSITVLINCLRILRILQEAGFTSRALPSRGLGRVPGPYQQDSSRVSSQNVSSTQKDQALDKFWLLIFLQHKKQGQKAAETHGTSDLQYPGRILC